MVNKDVYITYYNAASKGQGHGDRHHEENLVKCGRVDLRYVREQTDRQTDVLTQRHTDRNTLSTPQPWTE